MRSQDLAPIVAQLYPIFFLYRRLLGVPLERIVIFVAQCPRRVSLVLYTRAQSRSNPQTVVTSLQIESRASVLGAYTTRFEVAWQAPIPVWSREQISERLSSYKRVTLGLLWTHPQRIPGWSPAFVIIATAPEASSERERHVHQSVFLQEIRWA